LHRSYFLLANPSTGFRNLRIKEHKGSAKIYLATEQRRTGTRGAAA
jgi:hypothetical protein